MRKYSGLLLLLLLLATTTSAQEFDDVTIETIRLTDRAAMLVGKGGNLVVFSGDDGALLIDDQFAPLTQKIKGAVRAFTYQPIKFVLNTHWHSDHTGGNENMAEMGAVVVAHQRVRDRMSKEQFIEFIEKRVPASPAEALPVITFSDSLTFHFGSNRIRVQYVGPAHTDGDSIVHLPSEDVIHTGDVFIKNMYPFIDLSSGGSLDGLIEANARILKKCGPKTKVVPGHGGLSERSDVQAFHDMLVEVRERIATMQRQGRTDSEIIAAKPTADFDPAFGGGFIGPDKFVAIVCRCLKQAR